MTLIRDTIRTRRYLSNAFSQRKHYSPPTSTFLGTLEELLLLRKAIVAALPHLVRLAQVSDRPFSSLSDYITRTHEVSRDLEAVAHMIQALGVRSREDV